MSKTEHHKRRGCPTPATASAQVTRQGRIMTPFRTQGGARRPGAHDLERPESALGWRQRCVDHDGRPARLATLPGADMQVTPETDNTVQVTTVSRRNVEG